MIGRVKGSLTPPFATTCRCAPTAWPPASPSAGDFNPTNVIVGDDGELYVCDWAHVTQGLPEADAAMTYILFNVEYPEKAEAYLDLYSKKADVPKQKIHYWVPVVAAAELSRNRKESEEFLKSWIDVANDYE